MFSWGKSNYQVSSNLTNTLSNPIRVISLRPQVVITQGVHVPVALNSVLSHARLKTLLLCCAASKKTQDFVPHFSLSSFFLTNSTDIR
jgi:hypothetical protein